MINWILALIGMMIYFIIRYKNRNAKQIRFSFGHWVKDNWPECTVSILSVIALMLIFMNDGAELDIKVYLEKIPFIKGATTEVIKMVVALSIGYLNSAIFYTMFRAKVKK